MKSRAPDCTDSDTLEQLCERLVAKLAEGLKEHLTGSQEVGVRTPTSTIVDDRQSPARSWIAPSGGRGLVCVVSTSLPVTRISIPTLHNSPNCDLIFLSY